MILRQRGRLRLDESGEHRCETRDPRQTHANPGVLGLDESRQFEGLSGHFDLATIERRLALAQFALECCRAIRSDSFESLHGHVDAIECQRVIAISRRTGRQFRQRTRSRERRASPHSRTLPIKRSELGGELRQ